ncbi:MAG: ATP-binding protein [Elusimicrobiota bacterium]
MFDYFFTTKRNEGTGLGLALSYQIVQAHEGHLDADNSPEGGAVFTLKLPLA